MQWALGARPAGEPNGRRHMGASSGTQLPAALEVLGLLGNFSSIIQPTGAASPSFHSVPEAGSAARVAADGSRNLNGVASLHKLKLAYLFPM
jgi:hypothetical protein